MAHKNDSLEKRRTKLIKKLAREEFLGYNTQTKIVRDKTVYCRKQKHTKKINGWQTQNSEL